MDKQTIQAQPDFLAAQAHGECAVAKDNQACQAETDSQDFLEGFVNDL